jgi:hypothetical protein
VDEAIRIMDQAFTAMSPQMVGAGQEAKNKDRVIARDRVIG